MGNRHSNTYLRLWGMVQEPLFCQMMGDSMSLPQACSPLKEWDKDTSLENSIWRFIKNSWEEQIFSSLMVVSICRVPMFIEPSKVGILNFSECCRMKRSKSLNFLRLNKLTLWMKLKELCHLKLGKLYIWNRILAKTPSNRALSNSQSTLTSNSTLYNPNGKTTSTSVHVPK